MDEEETTFFNGKKITGSGHWMLPRSHMIPGKFRAAAKPAPFYHPDFRHEDLQPGATTEAQWQAKQELRAVGDNPY